jgi:hypothetical protein
MLNKIIYLTAIFALLLTPVNQAQDFAPVGTAVAQFLEIGIGARATAMGEAFTALPNDAGAVFWNPAGIVDVSQRSFSTTYNRWPAAISIGGAAFAVNFGHLGAVAISTTYLMTDDMDITTIDQPMGTGESFGISNYALGLTYARYLTDRFSIGFTGKLVHENYLDYGYTNWALDIGTIYRTNFHGMKLGMSILHFGPDAQFSGDYIDYSDSKSVDVNKPKTFETYSLPINFRFGVSFDLLNRAQHQLISAVDMIHSNNNLEQYNLGLEYGFHQTFFLRTGYKFNTDEGGFAFGTGIKFNLLALDYAYTDMGALQDIHRVSLALSF